ncbi:MAG: pilus assembly protein [Acidimicrobiales bacterium]|nr:pilus assembly protein [Acidimicrobiales bacterium]
MRKNERGAILVMVALSMASIITVMGVVVDGGHVFSERRQMQNVADAAALAGTRALDLLTPGSESAITTAVTASVTANGAGAGTITCRLIDEVLVDVGACPTVNTGTAVALKLLAAGVRVTIATVQPTTFMKVAGIDTFTARARAAAQIQGLRSGPSPFVMCAVGDTDPRANGDGQPIPLLMPDNSLNPVAVGQTFELQDPTAVGCGQQNAFKGLAATPADFPTPGPWSLLNGDHGINVTKQVVAGNSACSGNPDNFINCVVAVPLCYTMTPPVEGQLYCVRYAPFRITVNQSASRMAGVLLESAYATGGQGGGKPLSGEVRIIKLSE